MRGKNMKITLKDFVTVFEQDLNKIKLNQKKKKQVLEEGFSWYKWGRKNKKNEIEKKLVKLLADNK